VYCWEPCVRYEDIRPEMIEQSIMRAQLINGMTSAEKQSIRTWEINELEQIKWDNNHVIGY